MQGLTKALIETITPNGPTDPIAYYRRPVIGWLFRERINRGLALLDQPRYGRALEVGYASGAVQLVLAPHVDVLHGIDLDADPEPVRRLLEARGHHAELQRGDVCALPFDDELFDLVVCFSVIEHISSFARALDEMQRVMAPRGKLLIGMPSVNRTMELGFSAIGFRGIDHHHVTTPEAVRCGFEAAGLRVVRAAFLDLPAGPPLGLRLYYNWLLEKLR